MTIPAGDLTAAVDELAPADCPLMVHVSLRSFGTPIAGGADTLLDALLTRGRTVLVPAFTEPQFGLPAPAALRPARNGVDYGEFPADPPWPQATAYTPGCGLINTGLGVFPATLIKRGGAVRGDHPLNSFAASGPQAQELIAAQSPADVYGPVRELAAREGRILLIGVGLNRMTAIHLAEQQSGRRLFPRWAKTADGRVSMFEVGSCSEGFPRLEPVLHQHARPAAVGDSRWRPFPARQVLDTASTAIRENQGITHCGDSDCLLCQDSTAGGPLETTPGASFQDPVTPMPPSDPNATTARHASCLPADQPGRADARWRTASRPQVKTPCPGGDGGWRSGTAPPATLRTARISRQTKYPPN